MHVPVLIGVWQSLLLAHRIGELEHRAYQATRDLNFNIEESGTLRKLQLNELEELQNDVYDHARSNKAKLKFLPDQSILRKKLEAFDKVFLYDSKFHKLRSRWTGPFVVKIIYPHGAIEIVDPENKHTFKVNGQHLNSFLDGYESEVIQLGDPDYSN